MDNVINLSEFRSFSSNKDDDQSTDDIEKLLNTATAIHGEPLGVGLAAGRYAAMKLYQMHGRAETMAFFDSCIQTVEISEDISAK